MKLPGVISLRKLLPIWAMPNGGFCAAARHHVGEVEEDALRGLGAQVVQPRLVLDDAEVGLQHHVEVARRGPGRAGAAVGARDGLVDVDGVGVVDALLHRVVLLEVVLAVALVARLALHQRVGEGRQVTAGLPRLGWQDDAGVEADDVVAGGHHEAPPLTLDVLLQLHAERAVVPGALGAAVDLTARVDEPPALAEGDDVVEGAGGGLCHSDAPGSGRLAAGLGLLFLGPWGWNSSAYRALQSASPQEPRVEATLRSVPGSTAS